jgi:serine/threonine kinase 16
LHQLGEGGYAVVYLVSEMQPPEHPHPDPELRALKKVRSA